jgi:AraC-like DNA-binding protein
VPHVIPMIRAYSVLPMISWLSANGKPVEERLQQAGLGFVLGADPMRPIPLISVATLLRETARVEGPDIASRVVSETSILEILLLGKVALGTRTPADALDRISMALPFFCTHEHVAVRRQPDGINLRHFYALHLDAETTHLLHQYVATMTDVLCGMTGAGKPRLKRIEIAPHPEFGLEHLRPWFGDRMVETNLRTLRVQMESGVADRPFRRVARDRLAQGLPPGLGPLRGDGSFAGSARIVIGAMLEDGRVTVERLSELSGTGLRTLQRRLDAEGTSFSAILDDVRRAKALSQLAAGGTTMAALSAELGFARQSSLTRAVRRWAGKPPSHLRADAKSEQ